MQGAHPPSPPRPSPPPLSPRTSAAGTRRFRRDQRALLTAADERSLAQAIEVGRAAALRVAEGTSLDGDVELVAEGRRARHHFVEANVRLVQSIANRFRMPAHLDREDIVQDGMIGLEKAVEKFDWRRGYKFSTYATWWIRQSIQRGLESTVTTIRIPGHRTRELHAAVAAAAASGGRLDDELAMIDMLIQPESMDRTIGDGPDTLGALVASSDEGPDEAAERRVLRQQTESLLDHLDDVSAFAVAARFGLRGREPATYAMIADELGLTPRAVRRRVARAIVKLRPLADPIAA